MFRCIATFLDRIFVVIGALIFSQIPMFMQQYRLQLAGHVAELQFQIEAMRQVALRSGKSLEQFTQKFLDSSDLDFSGQGEIMAAMVGRLQELSNALTALNQASVWTRPYEFATHFYSDIFKSTLDSFEMGLSFTFEGMVYALIGIIAGYMFFRCLSALARVIFCNKGTKTCTTLP